MFLLFAFAFVVLLGLGGIIFLIVTLSQGESMREGRLKKLISERPSMDEQTFIAALIQKGYEESLVKKLYSELAWYLSEQPQFGLNPSDNAEKDYWIPKENITDLAERLYAQVQGRRPLLADWAAWDQRTGKAPIAVLENMLRFATNK
ncbi:MULTISPECIES: hypothetical protein [unclassified Siphonobacter]|uniref:hypothetical protein n=1 Tax=unclassified Siphonobacter TaxID=2635712 RepID=UPI000CAFD824|nr:MULTISPECIES: hypothetical protein [unclassified Siphonobacter]MDQ1086476.1 hypothetical protein [Siphonobacter sp. SORGH_AS_1065]MDR6196747.1 hypothetical protein [Siphonobacter sp. SORGH_AS_0500]PKK36086.1 hypothetical protein BWI96_13805 [Siphonobacter sp. SORGH_AS_0500]